MTTLCPDDTRQDASLPPDLQRVRDEALSFSNVKGDFLLIFAWGLFKSN